MKLVSRRSLALVALLATGASAGMGAVRPARAQTAKAVDAGAKAADAGATATTGASAAAQAQGSDAGAPTAPAKQPVDAAGTTPSTVVKPTGGDGATYTVRLRDLESRVDELKEQIRRSHTQLSLLSDTILSGGVAGSRAVVTFRNQLSGAYRLTRALFVLDGAVQFNRQDEAGALSDLKEIPIFSGNIPPGDHTATVVLELQGSNLAVFQYLKGYKLERKSSHSFTALEGKSLQITALVYEKGDVTTPFENRPAVLWNEKVGALPVPSKGKVATPNAGSKSEPRK